MVRYLMPIAAMMLAAPALADGDELAPVPARAVVGHAYAGDGEPSQIRFINVRNEPVNLTWIGFDGAEHNYAVIAPGQEVVQPTYVTHRWLVTAYPGGFPLEAFISTRSAARDEGTPQIALIR